MRPRTEGQLGFTNMGLVLLALTIHEVPCVLGALSKDDTRLTEDSLGLPSSTSPLPFGAVKTVQRVMLWTRRVLGVARACQRCTAGSSRAPP
ncbi:hypothetical protein C8Q70DRAFT_1036409 [Cubamyces menziesii]|nr:hypothetical protein C8Q70DRAFT_1036409 [Cubamyces menziesii]